MSSQSISLCHQWKRYFLGNTPQGLDCNIFKKSPVLDCPHIVMFLVFHVLLRINEARKVRKYLCVERRQQLGCVFFHLGTVMAASESVAIEQFMELWRDFEVFCQLNSTFPQNNNSNSV